MRLSPRHLHIRALQSSIRLSQTYIARAENRTKPQSLPTAQKDLIPTYFTLILSTHYLEMLYLRSLFFCLCIIYICIPPTQPIKLFYLMTLPVFPLHHYYCVNEIIIIIITSFVCLFVCLFTSLH
jgi:hypothetical protein